MQIQSIDKNTRVVRDDLFPFLGGGNKGRKIVYIAKAVARDNCNAVVSTGGIQSNHCRAVAVSAAENGWECTLVLHGSEDEFNKTGGNAKIMRLSGAQIVFTMPDRIAAVMDESMERYRSKGLRPYYIRGGGHTHEGGLAYIDAIGELNAYCINENWFPDYLFLPSGTGSTHSGILAGADKYMMNCKVIGISVARKSEPARIVVDEFYKELCITYGIKCRNIDVIVMDDFLCGGYEKYNEELLALSLGSLKSYGFILDTTYSGKAFYGMQEYIRKHHIKGNILFWHTGGIMNFFAQQNL